MITSSTPTSGTFTVVTRSSNVPELALARNSYVTLSLYEIIRPSSDHATSTFSVRLEKT